MAFAGCHPPDSIFFLRAAKVCKELCFPHWHIYSFPHQQPELLSEDSRCLYLSFQPEFLPKIKDLDPFSKPFPTSLIFSHFLLGNALEACGFFVVQSAIFSLHPKAWNFCIDTDEQIFLLTKPLKRHDTEICFYLYFCNCSYEILNIYTYVMQKTKILIILYQIKWITGSSTVPWNDKIFPLNSSIKRSSL